jgi:hypothetical protein
MKRLLDGDFLSVLTPMIDRVLVQMHDHHRGDGRARRGAVGQGVVSPLVLLAPGRAGFERISARPDRQGQTSVTAAHSV